MVYLNLYDDEGELENYFPFGMLFNKTTKNRKKLLDNNN